VQERASRNPRSCVERRPDACGDGAPGLYGVGQHRDRRQVVTCVGSDVEQSLLDADAGGQAFH
jgi:hypothetical protein